MLILPGLLIAMDWFMHLGCDKSHTDFGKQHPRLGSKPLFPLLRIKRGSEQKTALKILSLNLPRAQMRAPGRLIRLSLCTGAHSLPSCLTLCNPTACSPPSYMSMSSPGKNTGVGCHSLLQGVFLTQGLSSPAAAARQADSLPLSTGEAHAYCHPTSVIHSITACIHGRLLWSNYFT